MPFTIKTKRVALAGRDYTAIPADDSHSPPADHPSHGDNTIRNGGDGNGGLSKNRERNLLAKVSEREEEGRVVFSTVTQANCQYTETAHIHLQDKTEWEKNNKIKKGKVFPPLYTAQSTVRSASSMMVTLARICTNPMWRKRARFILPILMLVVYSASGGLLFWLLEGRGREARADIERAVHIEEADYIKNYTYIRLVDMIEQNYLERVIDIVYNGTDWRNCTEDPYENVNCTLPYLLLDTLNGSVLFEDVSSLDHLLNNYTRIMSELLEEMDKSEKDWTFWGSIFYCGTVYTTIGYGYMTPETNLGRALTIVYALFGIPLVLYNLSQLGRSLMRLIWRCYMGALRIVDICRGRRRRTRPKADYKREMAEFPFWIAISITIAWTLLCAALFRTWESEWDFFTSFYFFFQSLTTIGFGDVKPHYTERLVWSFILILIGLALVSMCWSLLQMKFDHMITTASRKITEKFVTTAMDDGQMTTDSTSIEREIEKITASENVFLSNLVSDDRRQALVNEWRKRAKMKHASCQTDLEYEEKETQTEFSEMRNSIRYNVPYRETRLASASASSNRRCNDDFRDLLRNLKNILGECRETLSNKDSGRGISSSVTHPSLARHKDTTKVPSSTSFSGATTAPNSSMLEM